MSSRCSLRIECKGIKVAIIYERIHLNALFLLSIIYGYVIKIIVVFGQALYDFLSRKVKTYQIEFIIQVIQESYDWNDGFLKQNICVSDRISTMK